jgi:hypothetical protein
MNLANKKRVTDVTNKNKFNYTELILKTTSIVFSVLLGAMLALFVTELFLTDLVNRLI